MRIAQRATTIKARTIVIKSTRSAKVMWIVKSFTTMSPFVLIGAGRHSQYTPENAKKQEKNTSHDVT
nr:MAG TPA: hypothetical protein [Caudoviricetes sp.]